MTSDSLHTELLNLRQRVADLEQENHRLQDQSTAAMQTLHDTSTLLHDTVQHAPNALAIFDREMRYMLVSDRFLEDYGITGQDVLGRNHYEIFPEVPERWKEVHQRSLAGVVERSDGDSFTRVDGSVTYNRWECRPWYDAQGQIGGILFFTEVITEQRQIEEALRQSQMLLANIIDNSPAAIYVKNTEGRYLLINRTFESLFHLDRKDIIGKTDHDFLPPDVADQNRQNDQAVTTAGHALESEETIPVDSKNRVYLSVKFPIYNQQGENYATGGISTDISSRKEAENDLRIFKALVESAPDAFATANLDGNISYANEAFRQMWGYGNATIGMSVASMYTEESQAQMETIFQSLQEQGSWRGEMISLRKDGETFPGLVTGFMVFDEQGNPQRLASITRNIAEQKRQEAEHTTLQQQVIDAQRTALRELSTPLIPITDEVVIMPLVGTIDSQRAQMVMETLLEGVAQHQAELAIVDITGVTVVDTQVAQALMSAAQAVNLLGTRVMLTGIQPQIAQTIVHLGVDLQHIDTRSSLQEGIASALARLRR